MSDIDKSLHWDVNFCFNYANEFICFPDEETHSSETFTKWLCDRDSLYYLCGRKFTMFLPIRDWSLYLGEGRMKWLKELIKSSAVHWSVKNIHLSPERVCLLESFKILSHLPFPRQVFWSRSPYTGLLIYFSALS